MNRVALIGKGYWGSKIIKYIPKYFDLVIAADSKTDLNIIWNDKSIHSVIIVTPIQTHYELTKKALLAGKNVFVEKPITLKYEEAKELAELAQERNLKIAVEYTQMFSKGLDYIQSQDIGEIEFIEMSTKHLGRFMNYDVFWLLASHHLSVLPRFFSLYELDFSFKEYMYYDGKCTNGSIECISKIDKKFKARLDVSLNFYQKEFCVNVYGSKGFARYDTTNSIPVSIVRYDKKYSALPDEMIKSKQNIAFDEMNNLNNSIGYFKDLLDDKVESNIDDAIRITQILERTN